MVGAPLRRMIPAEYAALGADVGAGFDEAL